MSERPSPQPDPEHLLHLKDNMLESWRQLPPEHQASMVLLLYTQVLAGEYGLWLRSSLKVMEQPESHGPFRFLPLLRISPEHLAQANLTEAEIAQMDEEDLMHISHEIVRHYTNDVFWEELEYVARETLADKQGE